MNQDPKQPNNPQANSGNPSVADSSSTPPSFSPIADLPPLPPAFQSEPESGATQEVTIPAGNLSQPPAATDQNPNTLEAPTENVELPPVITSSPKKKSGKGKIVATVIGVFLLIGGIVGGVLLTQQQQLFEQRAGDCYEDCRRGSGAQVCRCRCEGVCTRPDAEDDPLTPPGAVDGNGNPIGSGDVPLGSGNSPSTCDGFWCNGCGGFCLSGSYTGGGCNAAQQAKCGEAPVACSADLTFQCTKVDGTQGTCCPTDWQSQIPGTKVFYYCSWACYNASGGICDSRSRLNGQPCASTNLSNVPNCFNGVIQIDSSTQNTHMSYRNTCGDEPSPPPTTPPQITASCTNVKAYDTGWQPLTSAQLSGLSRGTAINFCVVGNATGGSFTKAKFTINGAAQAETTAQRPGSQDFCQSYTIPATGNSFTVAAQIYHATLGWK